MIIGNTPKNLNPFLPASLDNLFPTMPPLGTYYIPASGSPSRFVPLLAIGNRQKKNFYTFQA